MDTEGNDWVTNPDAYTQAYFNEHFKAQVVNNPKDVIWVTRWVNLHHRSWLTKEEWEKCDAHFKPKKNLEEEVEVVVEAAESPKEKNTILYERPGITIELMEDDEEDEGDKLTSSKEESKEKQKDDPTDSYETYESTLSGNDGYNEMPDDVD